MTMNGNRTEEENREVIRHDLNKNLFIEAGAGAGKTTLLVDRAVERLCTGNVDPSQIVIITFTNAAASELYNRIVSRLRELEKSDQTDPEKKKIIRNSLKHIDQMNISTIHHFCNAMLGQRIFEAGLGMNATYTEEDEMQERKIQFITDALSGTGETPEEKERIRQELDHLKDVLGWNYKGYIEDLFCNSNMADREEAVYQVNEELLKKDWKTCQEEINDFLKEIDHTVHYYAEEVPITVDDCNLEVKGLYHLFEKIPLKETVNGEVPEHDQNGIFTKLNYPALDKLRKALSRWNHGDGSYLVEALNGLKEGKEDTDKQGNIVYKDETTLFCKTVPKACCSNRDTDSKEEKKEISAKRNAYNAKAKEATQAISTILHENNRLVNLKKEIEAYRAGTAVRFVEKLSQKYQEKRDPQYISNDALLYRTRDLLRKEQARKILSERYRYLFVDEYQDTDQVQTDIIWSLCQKDENPDQLRDGSLVIVGDPKQSIYRFRGADSTLFETMKERFEKLQDNDPEHNEVIALHDNYRSNEDIIDAVNEGFQNRYTKPVYEPMHVSTARKAAGYQNNTFHGIFQYTPEWVQGADKSETKSLNNKNYIESVGKIINTLKNGDLRIMEKKDGTYQARKIRYSDILVLAWNKTSIPDVVDDLKSHDIPVSVLGSVDVRISPVERLVRIVEYLSNPNDRVARAAAAQAIYGQPVTDIPKEKYQEITKKLSDFGTLLKSVQTEDLIDDLQNNDKPEDSEKNDDADQNAGIKAKNRRKEMIRQNGLYDLAELVHHKDACAIVRYLVNHEEILFDPLVTISPVAYYDQKKQLHNLVESMESQGIYDLNEAAVYLEGYLNGTMEIDKEAELVPDKDQVRIMNLHKAKGLQAPIVILMERKKPEWKNTYQKGNEIHMVTRTVRYTDLATYADDSDEMLAEIKAADDQDIINLEYVEDTRAGEALIYLKKPKSKLDDDELTDELSKKAEKLTDVIGGLKGFETDDEAKTNPETVTRTMDDLVKERENLFKKNKDLSIGLYHSIIPSDFEKAQTSSGNQEETVEKEERPKGAVFGTVMHRCFELFVNRRETILNEKDSSASIQRIISQAVMENISDIPEEDVPAYQKYLTKVLTSFRHNNDMMEKISNAEEVYTEYPFSYYKDRKEDQDYCDQLMEALKKNEKASEPEKDVTESKEKELEKDQTPRLYIHGACDLVLKTGNSISVIDYKSDECHTADHKAFEERKYKTYNGQLTLYQYAMAEVFGVKPEDVRTELYLVDIH